MNQIEWTKKAVRQLRRVDRQHQTAIVRKVDSLADWPNTSNVKALTNHQHPYRLRAGNYRVFFSVDAGEVTIIKIEEVKKRDERTY